ncbi:alpha/beta hydrolase [Nakamurella alba]|uniref:alpha/beta hydrolase n=1 Tax=Nakamurella alba TaxID=2665158 RepID=UPI0018A9C21A|nr:alpha/beta hydrolase [Nakamurella alba]
MSDWSLLGLAADPVPGSPSELRVLAAGFAARAEVDRAAVGDLRAASALLATGWDSGGGSSVAVALAAPVTAFDRGSLALTSGAEVLVAYAGRMEERQSRCAVLLEAAQRNAATITMLESPWPVAGLTPVFERTRQIRELAGLTAGLGTEAALLQFEATLDATATAELLGESLVALVLLAVRTVTAGGAGPVGSGVPGSATATGHPGSASVAVDPALLAGAPAVPADPAAAARWWSGLSEPVREQLIATYPGLLGSAAGLPADVRDRASRASLAEDLATAEAVAAATGSGLPPPGTDPELVRAQLAAAGWSEQDITSLLGSRAVDEALARAEAAAGGDPVQLLIYDPDAFDGHGRAAISVGDMATADNVAVLVPGMGSDVPGYLDNQLGNALDLKAEADRTAGTTAVVAWVGYRAPGVDVAVSDPALAAAGAALLTQDLAGFAGTRTGDPGRTTVVAHSYGSTTASFAFAGGADADALVLIGSPGAGPADSVGDYPGLGPGSVFVGAASGDPVTTHAQLAGDGFLEGWEGIAGASAVLFPGVVGMVGSMRSRLGNDPAGAGFGATRFHAETGSTNTLDPANHSQYYRPGSESLANIAAVVKGRLHEVTVAPPRPPGTGHWDGRDPEATHVPRPPR